MIKIGLSDLKIEMTSASVPSVTASLSSQQLVNIKGFELFATRYYCTYAFLVTALNEHIHNG
jgi:hypothetical protein